MLVIRRTRPGIPEYWVLPGGGVEPSDESREAALHREIHEENAGKADIVRLLHTEEIAHVLRGALGDGTLSGAAMS